MKGSIPPCVMDKKLAEAKKALMSIPASNGQKMVYSALVSAEARIKHLELRLGETETIRDRIAMQVLPGILERGGRSRNFSYAGAMERAFNIADLYMAAREQGSAGVPGETTSPDFPIRG